MSSSFTEVEDKKKTTERVVKQHQYRGSPSRTSPAKLQSAAKPS
jgi:hypothetical protein